MHHARSMRRLDGFGNFSSNLEDLLGWSYPVFVDSWLFG